MSATPGGTLDLARLAADVEDRLLELPRARRRGDEIAFPCLLGDRHKNGDAHPSASYSVSKKAHSCKGCGASGGLVKGKNPIAQLLSLNPESYRARTDTQFAGQSDRSWEIRDTDGRVVAIHHRKDLRDGKKRVWWTTPDGRIGLGGIKASELPLYAVDRLGEREPGDDSPVIVCEGEPATDAVLALGFRAVGTVTGASSLPSAQQLESLRGADVVLWPDADDVGRSHMSRLTALLEGVAASVRVFDPADAGDHDDAVDWARSRAHVEDSGARLFEEIEEHAKGASLPAPEFAALADDVGYRLKVPTLAAEIEVTYLRRERHQLRGEVLTRCTLPGAACFEGVLSVADLNLSSSRSRREFARHLAEQAKIEDSEPWQLAVEELAQRVLAAERSGQPDVSLRDVQVEIARVLDVKGLRLPRNHPSVLFGDGDSAKSYLGLYVLGTLAVDGMRVGLADWELSEVDHRERLGRLFPAELPDVRYLRCARPILHEADRLRRWVRDRHLAFVVMDSVAFASGGAPESAEVAMQYFQVVRQLGQIGSLHIAHITKAQEGADRRPFGSAFWHNSPRATWYCKLAEREPGGTVSRIGLYPRKWNTGALPEAIGLKLTFTEGRTLVERADLADTPDLASTLPLKARMVAALRSGGLSASELAEEVGTSPQTIRSTVRRHQDQFRLAEGVVVLLEGRLSA